ncbi:hypothetical protein DPMN_184943 [Dreissena polymorpha]|uniref:Uncharacterized protein n=1 Tax=Dreissena polymorpha TaxID=45954 RepID=A0A9D4DKH6_DREPO|nr:hypothetical protein DPMN_184943 [Dreissena polymorpha]
MPRPPGGHVFQPTGIIFELVQDINGMNLLTKFYKDRTINVASRVKNAPPLGSHVFQANIIWTNLVSKFHGDLKINVNSRVHIMKNAPPPGGHVFQPTGIIFKLVQDIIGMNILTKFHEDRTINVASRVLTNHVFQANVTIFELIQDIIETNLLTEFHEDWTINVASRVLTRQMLTTDDRQKAITKAHHEHVVLSSPGGTDLFFAAQDITKTNVLTKFHEE